MKTLFSSTPFVTVIAGLILCLSGIAHADKLHAAVASNFANTMEVLAQEFRAQTGHEVVASYGSTAKLYTQITQGAPFDLFLAADREHPERLEAEKHSVANTRFSYAVGKLVLWSNKENFIDTDGNVLRNSRFEKLAIGNPRIVPYGAAAKQTLETLGLWNDLQDRLVFGENIAQTQQFVVSGNAQLGFLALAQIKRHGKAYEGSYWLVPRTLYSPIVQDAVLLQRGSSNLAAKAFLAFLKTPSAQAILENSGYDLP